VNNAGIATVSLLEEMTAAVWDEMIRINLRSVFLCTRRCCPPCAAKIWPHHQHQFAARSQGCGRNGALRRRQGGILGLTRSLSYEVAADNIVVNAICPGPIDTPMKLPPEWASKKQSELVVNRQGRVEEITQRRCCSPAKRQVSISAPLSNPNGGDIMV
jgi:3-oxoacyl-[acyl-carrier protein] reductase